MRAGVPLFILIGSYPHSEIAENFLNSIDSVYRLLEENEPPFIAKISKRSQEAFEKGYSGRVEVWLTHDEWLELVGEHQPPED